MGNKSILFRWFVAILGVIALLSAGCGGGGNGALTGGNGTMRVNLVDGTDPNITAVTINVDRVDANVGGQWVMLTDVDQTIDLMSLVFNEMMLAEKVVPAGHYGQVRIKISSATVTDSKGVHPLVIPSGMQSGIKINLDFDINPEEITEILLDFNVHQSIHLLGNGTYHLQPVIPAVVQVVSGTVSGTVTNGVVPLFGASVKATYTAGSAYPIGTVVNETHTMADGTFKLWALKAGTYTIDFSWTDPLNALTVLTATRTDVVVTATQDTNVGTVPLVGP